MTTQLWFRSRWFLALAAVALVVAGGVGGALLFPRRGSPPVALAPTAPANAPAIDHSTSVTVTLTEEALRRANVSVVPVRTGEADADLTVPAVVAPDGYREVTVTAASAGRILAALVEAGQLVRVGDPLYRLHSPEVAATEQEYRAARANLTVWERQVARLDRLVTIGAASQQEQDAARAEQVRLNAELESLRARLMLLGRTEEEAARAGTGEPNADVTIRAPLAGTVVQRLVNPGQNVLADTPLMTIVDLAGVWVLGDVYERDLSRVRVGGPATVVSPAFPGETVPGRITYIDPQLAEATRTARVRVEVPNRGGRLKLGMFVELRLGERRSGAVLVPRSAVQTIDQVDVVYVADPDQSGRFLERAVRLGATDGEDVIVQSGLGPGDRVVSTGSFLVRSQRERDHPGAPPPALATGLAEPVAAPYRVEVTVTSLAFSPEQVSVPANRPIELVFTRKDDASCATEVVFAALGIRKPLPLGKPVLVELPPQSAGTLGFACGMDMLRGRLVVK